MHERAAHAAVGHRAARPGARAWRAFAAMVLALALATFACADVPVPQLHAHVTDTTGTLTGAQVAQLEQRLDALEKRKGSQLMILILPTTQPEDIGSFSLKVAERNRIGRAQPDDGLLLLVAKDDRKARIEVGYGLEGVVTDAIASRVIREYLAPHFRENDYAGGLDAASAMLVKLVDGEPLPPPMSAQDEGASDGGDTWMFALFIGFLVGSFGAATRLKPKLLRRIGAGAVAATGAMLLLGAGVGLVLAGVVAFLVAGAAGSPGGRYVSGGSPGWGGGGWGGGSSGGGGGWSGGGGGFGGGGASGGW
jgi:uncharacterized protein